MPKDDPLIRALRNMESLSAQVDFADSTSSYQMAMYALAAVTRSFLRDHLADLLRRVTPQGTEQQVCRRCHGSGFIAYWDGSNYAGEGCPECDPDAPRSSPGTPKE